MIIISFVAICLFNLIALKFLTEIIVLNKIIRRILLIPPFGLITTVFFMLFTLFTLIKYAILDIWK